jgi:filamentous hemagglutinin family protein
LSVVGNVISFKGSALAQLLQPDTTLGSESSVINTSTTINNIPSNLVTGGAVRGVNLFHSFETFNISEGQGVYFNNPIGIERIISRVTGSSPSNIFGTLGVIGGTADLFLLNPNGIIFGPNASLDLKGSFLATTASSYIFEDVEYSAIEPSSSTLLSMSIPIGLKVRNNAGTIVNQSEAVDPISELPVGLQVQPGKTLALVGGDILMKGGFLTAPEGRIEVGSISGDGIVSISGENWVLGYEGIKDWAFGDIKLLRKSLIISAANNGSDIILQGRNIIIASGSGLFSSVESGSKPSLIKITATNSFKLVGNSSLVTSTIGKGVGGDVLINAKKVFLKDGSYIQSASSFIGSTNASGTAGNVSISSHQVEISGGAYINASTIGSGKGGSIKISASDYVNIFGISPKTEIQSGLYTISETGASGQAGSITLNTPFLRVADGATINVASFGTGAAGMLNINANSILLENNGSLSAETTGEAGDITLNAENIILRDHSTISTNATGTANGGNITINTEVLLGLENSDIVANASEGSGGQVNITAKGIFGFQSLTREELQQLLGPNQLDPSLLPSSDITAISQSNPSLNGQVTINTTEPDPSEGLVDLPTTVVDPDALVAQNACRRGSESEFTSSGRGGLPANPNQDLSNDSTQVGLVEPTSATPKAQTQSQSPTVSVTPQQSTAKTIAPAQGWVYNEKGEIVLVAYNPNVSSPQRLKNNTACAAQ